MENPSPHLVRANQQETNERRRLRHLPVALALRDPVRANEVVISARQCIEMWREKGLCSHDYIEAWVSLLNHPDQAAAILEARSLYADQLRQNSPFASVVRRLESEK